jgi:hypothetical protein
MRVNIHSLHFAAVLSLAILAGCTRTIEQKVAGIWKVRELQYLGPDGITDPASGEKVLEGEKDIAYELYEDHSVIVKAGSSILKGSWTYKPADNAVYIVYTGSYDTALFGVLRKKELINEMKDTDISITRTFFKEKKLKGGVTQDGK